MSNPNVVIPSEPLWIQLLQQTGVSDILDSSRKVVKTQFQEEVRDLLKKLSDAGVLAAAVMDESVGVIGFVDVLDLLVCVIEVTNNSVDITKERFENLRWEGQCFSRQTSGSISNLSQRNPFYSVSPSTSLLDCVKIFATEVHRLAVMENGALKNVISQYDIVQFLATRGVYIGTEMGRPLSSTSLAFLGVATVRDNVNVVECIRYMRTYKCSGVPVMDQHNRIVANFSATDLLGLNEANFHLLALPVMEFLIRIHGYPKPPVFVKLDETPEALMMKVVIHKVHRVYIVNEKMVPIGVVSLTDIMKWLLEAQQAK